MQQRKLGNTGITVGAIGLGCMGMSWAYTDVQSDEANSIQVIHEAIDLGVTLIDTADVYGPFTNEELVGRALVGRRNKVTLATKCGLVVSNIQTRTIDRDGSSAHIKAACDASLKRLNVEVIDLYQLHRSDPNVPIEESVGAMAELVQAGKVRAIGLSECDVPLLERAIAVSPIASLQSELSLWTRDVLGEILPWCQAHGVSFIPFSPLGRGFLTGRYRSAEVFSEGDFRATNPRFQPDAMLANLALVAKVEAIAQRLDVKAGQVALAWVLAQCEQVIPIPGTKQLKYLKENIEAADITLSSEDLDQLNALPTAVGGRY